MTSLIEIVIALVIIAMPIALGVTFIDKTGYNRWLGLLMIVPVINIGLVLFLIGSTWPLRRELAVRRLQVGEGTKEDGMIAYREAMRLQKVGRHQDAVRVFAMIEARFNGDDLARDAAISRQESEKQYA